jgi:glycosyltransferase involved in cell wall biosynthesis
MAGQVRVLVIGPSMDILGGQAVQVDGLLKDLKGVPDLRVKFQPIDPRIGPLGRIRGVRTALRLLLYVPSLLWRMAGCDVVHIFSAGLTSFNLWTVPALLIGRMYGKKVILNYHDGQADIHFAKFRSARPLIKLAHVIVTPSYFLVDVFARHGFTARSIFNVIVPTGFRYRQRGRLRPVLMTNRILEPLYNVDCILRAFRIVQQRYPEATLTVAHDGVSKPGLERLAVELGLRNTKFIGRVPHEKVGDLYDAADIYVTTPNFDNMPVSVLECYASGLPIVATRAGGIPYIATDEKTALLVDLDDHEAVAARCFRLLEDPELVERLTQAGRDELPKYQPERSRDEWAALYRQLTEPARR